MVRNNRVRSVVKAMKIFEELVYNGSPISLSRLSEIVDMNISTVHRMVNTLLDLGYVEQNKDGQYCLGLYAYEMAEIINQEFDFRSLVHPYLEDIVAECNETCNLVVLEDNQVVYLDQVESTNMVRMFAGIGSRGPAYCTGAGKMLLSYLSSEELKEYYDTADITSYTENTITNYHQLRRELRQIKEQDYALDLEEREKGVRCAAAPIKGRENRILGTISVSGPSTRITMDYLHNTLVPLITNKANLISQKLE
ncbi:MAG: IclR family transcriptional regulator [Halothermotrichaceae bacterium]